MNNIFNKIVGENIFLQTWRSWPVGQQEHITKKLYFLLLRTFWGLFQHLVLDNGMKNILQLMKFYECQARVLLSLV